MSLQLFNVLATLFAFGGLLAYDGYSFTELLVLTDLLIINCAITHYALVKIANDPRNGHNVMTIGIIMLFWIAYTLKLPVAILLPSAFWVVPEMISAVSLRDHIGHAFFIASLGYGFLLLTIVWAPSSRPIEWQMGRFRPQVVPLVFLCVLALVSKYVLKDLYSLGVPTVTPVDFGIPLIPGFVTMVIEIGFFILVNMLLFVGMHSGRGGLILAGMTAAFGNAGIELLFGSKEFLMYQLAVTFAYIFIFRKFGPAERLPAIRRQTLFVIVATGSIGLASMVLFKFFNLFRYARFSENLDLASALRLLSRDRVAETGSSFLELWSRLSGIEILSAVLEYRDRFGQFNLTEIISGAMTEKFTYLIIGTIDVNTRFATTAFGFFYIAGGIPGLIVGVILLGLFFLYLQRLILRARVDNHARLATLPLLWVLMVKLIGDGGTVVLVAKEFFVFVLVFWICAKAFYRGPPPDRAPPLRAGVQSPA